MNQLAVIERSLHQHQGALAEVLPKSLPVARLMRTVLVSIERLPQLLQCSQDSILNSAISAAVLGLEVDGVTGQGYLIPFKGRAQLVVGYKGYNTIGARAGITITAGHVREGDDFDYEKGSSAFVRHRPRLGNRAPIIGFWSCAAAPGRTPIIEVLSLDEVLAIKAKSPGARKGDSPWNDEPIGFPSMGEKSARRRLARSLPLMTMQQAVALEDAVDRDQAAHLQQDGTLVIDGEASPLPARGVLGDPDAVVPGWGASTTTLPLIGADGKLYQIADGLPEWLTKAKRVVARLGADAPKLRTWRQQMGPHLGEIAGEHPDAVRDLEAVIEAALERAAA